MLQARLITADCLPRLAPQYEAFCAEAIERYHWHASPPPLAEVAPLLADGRMEGLVAVDDAADFSHTRVEGFMLWALEPHGAIEINTVWLPEQTATAQTTYDVLMQGFLKALAQRPNDWDVVSHAMLGAQGDLVLTAPWYGLQPIGQAIQKFDLMNELAIPILHKQHTSLPDVPDDYRLSGWPDDATDGFKQQMAALIADSFKDEVDALWDPRFRTPEGGMQALALILSGNMGEFHPDWQTVLWHTDDHGIEAPIGFCFLLKTSEFEANIALIGVHTNLQRTKDQNLGLGKQVMRHSLVSLVKKISRQEVLIASVTATMGTDNIGAIHLYRRFGFQEIDTYPHCYLTRDTAANSYYGKRYFGNRNAGCCSSHPTPQPV